MAFDTTAPRRFHSARRFLLHAQPKKMSKLLGGVLGEVSQPRPGSAPPQVDEATGSTGLPGSSAALFTSPLSTSGLGLPPSSKDEAFLSDPDYIRFYYSNKNLNPRLTPPTMAGSPQRDLASPWSGATAAKPLETSGLGEQASRGMRWVASGPCPCGHALRPCWQGRGKGVSVSMPHADRLP